MVLLVNVLQPVEREMGINLGGRNISVAENSLDGAQVGAVFDHMRGAGVAQHVRRCLAPGGGRRILHHLPDSLAGELHAAMAEKKKRRGIAGHQDRARLTEILRSAESLGATERLSTWLENSCWRKSQTSLRRATVSTRLRFSRDSEN